MAEQIKMFSPLQTLTGKFKYVNKEAELNWEPNGYINLWSFSLSLSAPAKAAIGTGQSPPFVLPAGTL